VRAFAGSGCLVSLYRLPSVLKDKGLSEIGSHASSRSGVQKQTLFFLRKRKVPVTPKEKLGNLRFPGFDWARIPPKAPTTKTF